MDNKKRKVDTLDKYWLYSSFYLIHWYKDVYNDVTFQNL